MFVCLFVCSFVCLFVLVCEVRLQSEIKTDEKCERAYSVYRNIKKIGVFCWRLEFCFLLSCFTISVQGVFLWKPRVNEEHAAEDLFHVEIRKTCLNSGLNRATAGLYRYDSVYSPLWQ